MSQTPLDTRPPEREAHDVTLPRLAAADEHAHRAVPAAAACHRGGARLDLAATQHRRRPGRRLPGAAPEPGSLAGPVRLLRRLLLALVRRDLPAAVHLAGRLCGAALTAPLARDARGAAAGTAEPGAPARARRGGRDRI